MSSSSRRSAASTHSTPSGSAQENAQEQAEQRTVATSASNGGVAAAGVATQLATQFGEVRAVSEALVQPLQVEDYGVQPMADASPPKWHLAHTSWFFETFLLQPYLPGYQPFSAQFDYLFNSYYNGVGAQFPRVQRGNLSRPTVSEVQDYRRHVNHHMQQLLQQASSGAQAADVTQRTVLGLHHEQQHQELLLTDLKYNFGHNPLYPVYQRPPVTAVEPVGLGSSATAATELAAFPLSFLSYAGGRVTVGVGVGVGEGAATFCFDNETPKHDVLLQDFGLANRLVTNGEYLAFMQAGGYQRSELWLANAWTKINEQGWCAPLYWVQQDGKWFEYQLSGLAPLDLSAPVCHLSYYEATAYAQYSGARLPTEFEWEHVAQQQPVQGNFLESGQLQPSAASAQPLTQLFGDVWEWTSSSYGAYPGFEPLPGTLGEYNGKFMSEQLVLRGGSCFSSRAHLRASYRNFFYPADRWQMTGLRLACNA